MYDPKRQVCMASELQQVAKACSRLQDMLTVVTQYVDDVIVSEPVTLSRLH